MSDSSKDVLGPRAGKAGFLGSIGVRFMIDGDTTESAFSLIEHPMSARALATPLHRHLREDEYSYVLEGRMGAVLGDDVVEAGPGDLVFKPRGQWHTFWNAGDTPCRILEIISPAGFEGFFAELVVRTLRAGDGSDEHSRPDRALRGSLSRRAARGLKRDARSIGGGRWRGLDSAPPPMEDEMPQYTRVASFEFDEASLEALLDRIRSTGMPDDVPAKRVTVLADRATGKVIVEMRFDSEDDLRTGSATLDAMSPPEVGTRRRVGVEAFEVVLELEGS